ncbi:MAG: hypothetical protein KDJ16_03375 [Hyphomicrobiales bacterium]|nr:hypothetical protein [Hyphomicrobiales bacterium]
MRFLIRRADEFGLRIGRRKPGVGKRDMPADIERQQRDEAGFAGFLVAKGDNCLGIVCNDTQDSFPTGGILDFAYKLRNQSV